MTRKNRLETFKCKFLKITNFKQVDFHSLLQTLFDEQEPFGIFLQFYIFLIIFLLCLVVSQFFICCCSVTPRDFIYFHSETFLYPHPFFLGTVPL